MPFYDLNHLPQFVESAGVRILRKKTDIGRNEAASAMLAASNHPLPRPNPLRSG